MRKLKLLLLVFLCAVLLIGPLAVMLKLTYYPLKSVTIHNYPTVTSYTDFYEGNNWQKEATIWLGSYGGRIFYFGDNKIPSDKTKFDDFLCVFQDGELVKIRNKLQNNDNCTILGAVDGFVYYRKHRANDYEHQKLYSFDLQERQETFLYCGSISRTSNLYFADDGTVYFPLRPGVDETTQYVHVEGDKVLGVGPLTEGYSLGNFVYYVLSDYSDVQVERIVKTTVESNAEVDELSLGQAYRRSIIPYEGGLLVHNEGLNSLLYRIESDGSVTELFNVSCLDSNSAVNIHGTDAYISVLRYEKYGDKGMLRYENDSLEGTYRINLLDGSVEKINNYIFDGIYNLDNSCFYCCDSSGNIYKMDFDGTVSPVMLLSDD